MKTLRWISAAFGLTAAMLGACGSDSDDSNPGGGGGSGATDGGGGSGGNPNNCAVYCQKADSAGCAPANCASFCSGKSTCVPSWNALVECAASTGSVTCNAGTAEVTGCDAELAAYDACNTPDAGSDAAGGTGGRPINLPAGCVSPSLVVECDPLTSAQCDTSTQACDFWTVDGAPGFYCLGGNSRPRGAPCDNVKGPYCQPKYHCSPDPNAATDAGSGGSAGASGSAGAAGSAGLSATDASVPVDAASDAVSEAEPDASGASCAGHCGSDQPVPGSDPACYCDDACEGNGDCCADKRQQCPIIPEPGICQKMCCSASDCATGEVCNPFDPELGSVGICQPQ